MCNAPLHLFFLQNERWLVALRGVWVLGGWQWDVGRPSSSAERRFQQMVEAVLRDQRQGKDLAQAQSPMAPSPRHTRHTRCAPPPDRLLTRASLPPSDSLLVDSVYPQHLFCSHPKGGWTVRILFAVGVQKWAKIGRNGSEKGWLLGSEKGKFLVKKTFFLSQILSQKAFAVFLGIVVFLILFWANLDPQSGLVPASAQWRGGSGESPAAFFQQPDFSGLWAAPCFRTSGHCLRTLGGLWRWPNSD